MANYEATKYDYSGANLVGIEGVNTGLIVPWSDASIPSGFLECDGAAVSRTTYANLFAVIGTTHGSGDGSTTFNLPDLSGRCCQNESPGKSLASQGGAANVTCTGNVGGSSGNRSISIPTMASHSHPSRQLGSPSEAAAPGPVSDAPRTNTGNKGGGGGHSHPISANFSGGSKSVLQPYITMVYIIKT